MGRAAVGLAPLPEMPFKDGLNFRVEIGSQVRNGLVDRRRKKFLQILERRLYADGVELGGLQQRCKQDAPHPPQDVSLRKAGLVGDGRCRGIIWRVAGILHRQSVIERFIGTDDAIAIGVRIVCQCGSVGCMAYFRGNPVAPSCRRAMHTSSESR